MATEASQDAGAITPEEHQKQAQAIWAELDKEDGSAGDEPPERSEPAPKDVEPEPKEAEGQKPKEEPKQAAFSDDERALLRQIPEVISVLKSTVGRVGSLQSELAKIGKAAASDGAGEQPTDRQIDKAAGDPAKWAALKKDFPDWAEGVEAFVSTRVPSAPQIDFDKEVGARVDQRFNSVEAARREEQMDLVSLFDPEWEKKKDSPEFSKWLASQPADYQQVAGSTWKPKEVLRILKDFDQSMEKQGAPKRSSKLSGAELPRSGASKATPTKTWDEMTPEEQWAALDREEGVPSRRR